MFPSSKGKSRQFRKKSQTEDEPKEPSTAEPITEDSKIIPNTEESKDNNNDEDDFEAKLKQREQRKTTKKRDDSKDKKTTTQPTKTLLSFAEVRIITQIIQNCQDL